MIDIDTAINDLRWKITFQGEDVMLTEGECIILLEQAKGAGDYGKAAYEAACKLECELTCSHSPKDECLEQWEVDPKYICDRAKFRVEAAISNRLKEKP